MPSLITHFLFARKVAAGARHEFDKHDPVADAFRIGAQGPDLLFYSGQPSVKGRNFLNRAGSEMHNKYVNAAIGAMIGYTRRAGYTDRLILEAYIKGYLCHYALDRHMHPYVYWAVEQMSLLTGIEDGDSYLHSRVETALDIVFLRHITGKTILEFRTPAVVRHSDKAENVISAMYERVIMDLYGKTEPKSVIHRSFGDMRRAVRLFYSPYGIKRFFIKILERLLKMKYRFYSSLSHSVTEDLLMDYSNSVGEEWVNGFTGEKREVSVFELFEEAYLQCLAMLGKLDRLLRDGGDVLELTGGLSFDGELTDLKHFVIE